MGLEPLERVRRLYNVRVLTEPMTGRETSWRVTCPKCNQRWSLPVGEPGLQAAVLRELFEHARDHEEVTRRIRNLRKEFEA